MANWLQAGAFGLMAGMALLIGAAVAFFVDLPHRLIAAVMGFGGGVLISVLSFELMGHAVHRGGFLFAASGFLGGAVVFSGLNWILSTRGARHRKRCGGCVQQPTEAGVPGSGLAIALGALLDGIPESMVIGLSLINGEGVNAVVLAGFFLANIPQGLSGTAGMKLAGRSATYIFGIWIGITILCGAAAICGYAVVGGAPQPVVGATTAFAAGAVLAMLAETMIPEAFEKAQHFIGVITVAGFLVAFSLTRLI